MFLSSKGGVRLNIFIVIMLLCALGAGLIISSSRVNDGFDKESGIYKNTEVVALVWDVPKGKHITAKDIAAKKVTVSEPYAILYNEKEVSAIDGQYVSAIALSKGSQLTRKVLIPLSEASPADRLKRNEVSYVLYYEGFLEGVKEGDSVFLVHGSDATEYLPVNIEKIDGKNITITADKSIISYVIVLNNSMGFEIKKQQ